MHLHLKVHLIELRMLSVEISRSLFKVKLNITFESVETDHKNLSIMPFCILLNTSIQLDVQGLFKNY